MRESRKGWSRRDFQVDVNEKVGGKEGEGRGED